MSVLSVCTSSSSTSIQSSTLVPLNDSTSAKDKNEQDVKSADANNNNANTDKSEAAYRKFCTSSYKAYSQERDIKLLNSSKQHTFTIEHLDATLENCERIQKIVSLWIDLAEKNNNLATENRIYEYSNIHCSSLEIIWGIDHDLNQRILSHKTEFSLLDEEYDFNAIILSKDQDNNPQAIALLTLVEKSLENDIKPSIVLELLATNPNNIKSPGNTTGKSGAGTSIITYLAKLCIEKKYDKIHLQPVDSSIEFYKKFSFEVVVNWRNEVRMNLTNEKIQQLMKDSNTPIGKAFK